jgi:aminopeptidase-like protein
MQPCAESLSTGRRMHDLVRELFPLCRSITGEGVRATLRILAREVPLEVHEIPTGTPVLDWTIPKEWNIRDAYVADARGERLVDLRRSSLHVVSYSTPVRASLTFAELRPHLHTLPDQPDRIPYRTCYPEETWGFCLAHRDLERFREDERYDVVIDATLAAGALTYGEIFIPGRLDDEVLISTHISHPSLANDNLAGVAVAVELARRLRTRGGMRLSYRFVFVPEGIGAIAWLALNRPGLRRLRAGLVIACAGDRGRQTYKRSRCGAAEVDRAAAHVLAHSGDAHSLVDFSPEGYDERQYGSPGFDLPVGCLMRTPPALFPEHHTSADDPEIVTPEALAGTYRNALEIVDVLDGNRTFRNLAPYGEPQLARRGLSGTLGGKVDAPLARRAMLWVLNLSDGRHALLDIADRSQLPFRAVRAAAETLLAHGLLAEATAGDEPAARRTGEAA